MHKSRLSTFVIDCKAEDIDAAARFWAQALGKDIAPVTPESGNYRELVMSPSQPMILLQKVSHDSRIHLDIEADDIEAEVRRLEALGAKRVVDKGRWWVLEAPTGQRFCVVHPQRGALGDDANRWG
ncbi:MAG: VOC family protein [Myxococcota bacterium]